MDSDEFVWTSGARLKQQLIRFWFLDTDRGSDPGVF